MAQNLHSPIKNIVFFSLVFSLVFSALFFAVESKKAFAGFGITPPYVQNDRLTRGSYYEQRILLVRNDPIEDLKVEVKISVPEIGGWFSVDKGNEFIFKKGEKRVPIIIRVQVPEDAEYGNYKGDIRIRTSPVDLPIGGGVSIALGAQVDVDISVVDKILDFEVKTVKAFDLEEGYTKWGLFFPGKIRLFIKLKNTGNAKFGPTKVKLDIFDLKGENLLETVYSTNKIRQIEPFVEDEVVAELPTRLKSGRYLAKYTIFKNNDSIAKQGEISLSISVLGSIPGYEGYGFWGLSLKDKLKVFSVFGGMFAILAISTTIFVLKRRKRRKISRAA